MSSSYQSTFTPDGELEMAKVCSGCDRFLSAKSFKGAKGSRDGINGYIRNRKCRDCESSSPTIPRKRSSSNNNNIDISYLEDKIKSLESKHELCLKVFKEISDRLSLLENK